MSQRVKHILACIAIILVCWLDHQLLSEGRAARYIAPLIRQSGHLAVLILTMLIGYWGWKKNVLAWTKNLWLLLYLGFTGILIVTGLLTWLWNIPGEGLLNIISNTRYAFCSPLIYMIIYVLTRINKA